MPLPDVMARLAAAADPQYARTYRRHGAVDPIFGVSTAILKDLAKTLKKERELAPALWATGTYDAMCLAALLADPARMTDAEADDWLVSVRCYATAGALAGVVGRSPVATSRARAWMADPAEYPRTTGYDTLAVLLRVGGPADDGWLADVVRTIEAEISTSPNRARHAMNMALIAIGGYRPALRAQVFATAGRIGPVVVDHGDTACVTPAIVPYVEKMVAAESRRGR